MASPRNRTLRLAEEDLRASVPRLSGRADPGCVYAADVLEGLAACPPADLVFADPPYDATPDFHAAWISAAARALRPGGSIYVCCDWRFSGLVQLLLARDLEVRNRITWGREKGRGAARNWKQAMEDVWFATKGDGYVFNLVKWRKPVIAPYREDGRPKDWGEDGGGRFRMTHPSNHWTDLCVPFWSMPENTEHPYQKPEKLVQRVIEASSRPGDLVVDPFLGSGTTAVVAARLGRRFIGFEREERWVRTALKRLRERP
jgi:site-specific DNA-methyltransferase (adenine-specific)